jgi:hypothetical protein
MANVLPTGPPPLPKEPGRSGRHSVPSHSSSKSPAPTPHPKTAPPMKEKRATSTLFIASVRTGYPTDRSQITCSLFHNLMADVLQQVRCLRRRSQDGQGGFSLLLRSQLGYPFLFGTLDACTNCNCIECNPFISPLHLYIPNFTLYAFPPCFRIDL